MFQNLLTVFASVFGIYLLFVITNIFVYVYYVRRIWNDFPPMTWLTIEDAKEQFGVPNWACRRILPDFRKVKLLEIRPRGGLDEAKMKRARRMTFNRFSIELYEFRIIHGPTHRKRPPLDIKEFFKLFPGLEPPPVPG